MTPSRLERFGLPEPPSPLPAAEAALHELPIRVATRLVMRLDQGWSQDPGIARLLSAILHQATGGEATTDFSLVATALWCAADIADDLMDGDVAPADIPWAHLDAIRLQALAAGAAAALPQGPARVQRLLLTMCEGQAADIAGREAPGPVDVAAIVAGKAGAEVGGLCGLAACVAGVDPEPWERAGTHLGALLQRVSDVHDLLGSPVSKDWRAAHPASALRDALEHDTSGWLRRGLAGRRDHTQAFARSIATASGAARAQSLGAVATHLDGVRAAASVAQPPGALDGLIAAAELAAQIGEQLWPPTPRTAQPRTEPVARRWEEIRRFVTEHALAGDSEEVHRWGLFGEAEVRADLFSTLVTLRAAEHVLDADTVTRLRAHAWSRRTAEQGRPTWRFYPGFLQIPEDADDVGLALQVFGDQIHADTIARLQVAFEPQGWVRTWLGEPTVLTWNPTPCPVVTANAWAGLDHVGASPPDPAASLRSLTTWAMSPGDTAHYPRGVAIAWVLLQLCGLSEPPPGTPRTCGYLASHLRRSLRLDGRIGSRLETALAARALAAHDQPLDAHVLAESLLRHQDIDGGFAPDAMYRTLTRGQAGQASTDAAWFRSRVLTAAWVLGACPHQGEILIGAEGDAASGPGPGATP